MTTETYSMKANGKEIMFSRPYLNDDKELTFLHCSAFQRFPNMEFILREKEGAIELRQLDAKKKVLILLKGNEEMLQKAKEKKEEVLNLLRDYTKRLQSGQEKVVVFKTGSKKYPYYFTTETIMEYSTKSCKFVAGFIYFVNLGLKKAGKNIQFDDYDKMQEYFIDHFKDSNFKEFHRESIDKEEVLSIPFNQFVQLLA